MTNGYVKETTLYESITWGEDGEEFYSLFISYDEAFLEADEEEDRVRPVTGLVPTQKLLDQSLVRIELLNVPAIITGLYAELVLEYDGIYWDEVLDISAYSAPRGVIFNDKIASFDVVNSNLEVGKKASLDSQLHSASLRAAVSHPTDTTRGKEVAPER